MLPKSCRFLAFLFAVGTFCFSWFLASYFHRRLPNAKQKENEFNAYMAKYYLHRLTSFGPRPAGSYENDVQAVTFLRDEILKLKKLKKSDINLELDIQNVTGSFTVDFVGRGIGQHYSELMNVVVRLSPPDDQMTGRPALLINAHFDSVPEGPGASDDGANCAVMLELIRVLVNDESTVLNNNLVLLFNGAEETGLPASHGFISQHPWASDIKAFINLEGAGSGGRELLFQAGPGNPWLIDTFIAKAPHPFASVIGQEIFQSGVIPSDTDFRIFRDFAHIPGLDIAYVKDGYVYHTHFDTADRVPVETLQRVGDNVLAVTRELTGLSNLGSDGSQTPQVFFDVFGLFMVSYPQWAGILINLSLVLVSCCLVVGDMFMLAKKSDLPKPSFLQTLLITTFSNVMILVCCIGVAYLVAVLLALSEKSMSWYSVPKYLFPLYATPSLLVAMAILLLNRIVISRSMDQYKVSPGIEGVFMFHSTQFVMALPALVFTACGYNSAFIFSMPLLFNLLYCLAKDYATSKLQRLCCGCPKEWTDFLVYLVLQIIPLMMWSYVIQLLLIIFIPIMGRRGTSPNPDTLMGIVAAASTFILVQPFLSMLISLGRQSYKVLMSLTAITFTTIFLIIMLTEAGFPFSGNPTHPTPKRLVMYHTRRTISNRTDSGFLFGRVDFHDTQDLYQIQEYRDAEDVSSETCSNHIGCAIPVYQRSNMDSAVGARWYPTESKPNIMDPGSLKVVSEVEGEGSMNVTLELTGSNRMLLVFSPNEGVSLRSWSVSEDIKSGTSWNERETFFINFVQGLNLKEQRLWLLLDLSPDWKKENGLLEVSLTTHHNHGKDKTSPSLDALMKKIPFWVTLSSWNLDLNLYSI